MIPLETLLVIVLEVQSHHLRNTVLNIFLVFSGSVTLYDCSPTQSMYNWYFSMQLSEKKNALMTHVHTD